VQRGETVTGIAREYGVSSQKVITDNGLENQNRLAVGQALLIQFPETVHTVRPGDTLYTIAQQYGTTVLTLYQNNPYLAIDPTLFVGQQLTIAYRGQKIGTLSVNGYAYPYINRNVLFRVLPLLTHFTIFGYGFTEEGDLIEPDDTELIRLAYQFKAAPIMLLSSVTETGTFSTERAGRIFRNPALQDKVIDQILIKMREKGYLGLDIDFEFVAPEDADAFISFIQNTTARLNAEGYTVNVDLAPKTSSAQQGLLYEAHDYERIGAIADTVLLMTYEWGFTFGPPMAVAPINQVKRVVNYAVTVIPRSKIFMCIPNYGYDWVLPYQRGVTVATVFGNQYAAEVAARYNAVIEYDETAQSPFFYFTSADGNKHVVWFEDVRSIQAKYGVITDNTLLGAGYWNAMRPFAQNWAYLNAMFDVKKVVV
jgi:spore germination protein